MPLSVQVARSFADFYYPYVRQRQTPVRRPSLEQFFLSDPELFVDALQLFVRVLLPHWPPVVLRELLSGRTLNGGWM